MRRRHRAKGILITEARKKKDTHHTEAIMLTDLDTWNADETAKEIQINPLVSDVNGGSLQTFF
ncbi:hypothetical protein AKJ16_DCAP20179 [Drosera capensis]